MSKNLFSDWESNSAQTAFRPGPPAQPLLCDATEPDDNWPFDDDDDGADETGAFCFERAWIGARVTLNGEPAKLMRDMTYHMVRIDAVWSDESIYCFCDTARHVLQTRGGKFTTEDEEDTGFETP